MKRVEEIRMVCVWLGLAALLASFARGADLPPAAGGASPGPPQVTAKFTAVDFAPDGSISGQRWGQAAWIQFDASADGKTRYPATTQVAALWSARYLYFAFRSHYTQLAYFEEEDPALERWELWDRDVVEVFLNPEPEQIDRYYEFDVAPNNQWADLAIDKTGLPSRDASWNSGFSHAVSINVQTRIWSCELRIPFSAISANPPPAGGQWGVNFFRREGARDDRRTMAWRPVPDGGMDTPDDRFGVLRFAR
jgi:alpha-galactosidase